MNLKPSKKELTIITASTIVLLFLFTFPSLAGNGVATNYFSCAKAGEKTVSNFDMTTGKINPNIKEVKCCPGLKSISEKQIDGHIKGGACAIIVGVNYGICSPCGNGVCNTEYEDKCNCPTDCH